MFQQDTFYKVGYLHKDSLDSSNVSDRIAMETWSRQPLVFRVHHGLVASRVDEDALQEGIWKGQRVLHDHNSILTKLRENANQSLFLTMCQPKSPQMVRSMQDIVSARPTDARRQTRSCERVQVPMHRNISGST